MGNRLEFTIKDLEEEPFAEYVNFEGENRVFIIFNPVSLKMIKLKEGDKFVYKGKIYRIIMRIIEKVGISESIRFNCLKLSKTEAERIDK